MDVKSAMLIKTKHKMTKLLLFPDEISELTNTQRWLGAERMKDK